MEKKRNLNGDIIRCVAVISVVCVHFFLNSGFYQEPVNNLTMYFMTTLRTSFMVCVPLFMLLTGYFMSKKTLSKGYYKGLIKTLSIYLLCSIACVVYKIACFVSDGVGFSVKSIILSFFSFSAAPYAWYINMYIGLFLIIPFLNGAYSAVKTKKQKQVLVATFLILTTLPSVFNIFNFEVKGWFLNPSVSSALNPLVPDWWKSIYPITYYFIGAYLKEFDFKISKRLNLGVYLLSVIIFGIFNVRMSGGQKFLWGIYQDWGGFENVIMSTLLFTLLLHLNFEKTPRLLRAGITKISELSLGIYLVSYIFDNALYTLLRDYEPTVSARFKFFPVMTVSVFVLSAVLSYFINVAYKYLEMLVMHIAEKKLKSKNT